jgi:hypothetical protein
MVKKALLIGINYKGTSSELNGCINDVDNLKEMLINVYKYKEEEITVLTDDTEIKPTQSNIIKQLYNIVLKSNKENVDDIWISYSGHGSYVVDKDGDEKDKRDEVLVPLDYQTKGVISDDILHHIIENINEKTKCICLIDACHSASVLDLKYTYVAGNKSIVENAKDKSKSNLICISGCQDYQTSADSCNVIGNPEYSGAMTSSFLYVMKQHNYDITCYKLLSDMRRFLKSKSFKQVPQITCTQRLSTTSVFSLNNKNNSYMVV